MQLVQVRREYDQNYREMLRIIQEMGGDENILHHKKIRSPLYFKLRKLQKREHQLDALENKLRSQFKILHKHPTEEVLENQLL